MKRHQQIHAGKKRSFESKKDGFVDNHVFKCKICDISFKDQRLLRRHQNNHNSEKTFHCKTCQKSFLKSSNLKRHEYIHTGEKEAVLTLSVENRRMHDPASRLTNFT